MDVYNISAELKFPNQIGATLNLEERYTVPIKITSKIKVRTFSLETK